MSDPVAAYRRALGDPEAEELPVAALDHLGVPVWATTGWTAEGAAFTGTGFGPDDDAARASAWGELAEGMLAHAALRAAEPVRASYAALLAERGPRGVLDPRLAPLPAGSPWRPADELAWLAMTARSDGREVLVPAELVAAEPGDLPGEHLFTPVTNGLGAGLDEEAAFRHGVGELLQRDGNAVTYRALDRGVALDLDGLADEVALQLLERYDAEGLDVTVKLAGVSCGVASVYCVARERDLRRVPHSLMLAACGEGAHPRRDLAVRKALLELAASRVRRMLSHAPLDLVAPVLPERYLRRLEAQPPEPGEDRALQATLRWRDLAPEAMLERLERVFAVRETVPLASLPDGEGGDPLDHGFEVLWRSFGEEGAPATAGKAFVPGLEVESLSYARIGPHNLAQLRGCGFAGVGAPPPGAVALPFPEGLPAAWLDLEAMDAVVGELYALYREPGRHAAAFAGRS